MTAPEIVGRLLSRPITPERVQKLRGLCWRVRVPFESVVALLSDEAREAVNRG